MKNKKSGFPRNSEAIEIGKKIREIRTDKRLSIKELGERTKLTSSFISQVEKGQVSPSISSLRQIALALGTKISYLLGEEELEEFVFIEKNKRKKILSGESKVICEALAAGALSIKMEPLILTLEPGAETGTQPSSHDGEEFGIVIKGVLEFSIRDKKYIMNEGDSVYFKSSRPHKLVNTSNENATALWVIHAPSL